MSAESPTSSKVEDRGDRNGTAEDRVRQEIEAEFNVQRAKMKELFLQKEDDLRKLMSEKDQLSSEVVSLRAELQQLQNLSHNQKSEIQNLQLLVNETVEASATGSEELRRLRSRNIELEQQMAHLRQQQDMSMAPGALVRNLARKLGADTEFEQPQKKGAEYDELIRSVVQERDTEIMALKDKVRETDSQLQEALKRLSSAPQSSAERRPDTDSGRSCDMCANYEKQLVHEQQQSESARERARTLDQALKQATEELESIRSVHDDTVRSWRTERAASTQQLEELKVAVEAAQRQLEAKVDEATQAERKAVEYVTNLTVDRETLQRQLDSLERDNAMLIGQYTKKAAEMQNEIIDVPDNLEDLQVYALQLREQLICCQIGRESALEGEREIRNQLLEQGAEFHRQEEVMSKVRMELQETREELDRLQTEREQMKELGDKLRHSNDMIEQLLNDKKRLQGEVQELRSRVSVLQQELDNSEKVQQDFVRLSQSLQVQLQRIREADTEVRWQHDEDVNECPSCHTSLPAKKKVHCRHCGRIFCQACVKYSIPSGPRRVPARVCSVCRTLLQPDTAPYFSTDPPHSPD